MQTNRYRNPITAIRSEVIALLQSGLSCTEVAKLVNRDRMSVLRLAKIEGINYTRGKPGSKPGEHYTTRSR